MLACAPVVGKVKDTQYGIKLYKYLSLQIRRLRCVLYDPKMELEGYSMSVQKRELFDVKRFRNK